MKARAEMCELSELNLFPGRTSLVGGGRSPSRSGPTSRTLNLPAAAKTTFTHISIVPGLSAPKVQRSA
jgi:hypothetical protein